MNSAKGSLVVAVGVTVVMSLFAGCAQEEETTKVRTGRGARNQQGDVAAPGALKAGSPWSGYIYAGNQGLFQEATGDFVSSFMNPSELGTVSSLTTQNTGVRFSSTLNSNRFNGNLQHLQIQGGTLDLLIVDSEASAGRAPSIVINSINLSGSSLSGQSLMLTFADSYSQITLQGSVTGEYFAGTISFTNLKSTAGQAASWSPWASFAIPKCHIFAC